ncbi:MAG: hypothetical protein J7501_14415 [Bdellovibrio sp.]|nr:hypothetical protein [Bdellovibrio sp.]
MKLHLSLNSKVREIALIAIFLFSGGVFAQGEDPNGLVEVEVPQDNLAPYKERRDHTGIYFGIVYENFLPDSYVSPQDSLTYNNMFGSETIPLIGINFDYKWNMSLGSLAFGLGGAIGSINDARSGSDRTLDVTRYLASIKFTADNLMMEPYVAPYIGVSAYMIGVKDTAKASGSTQKVEVSKNTPIGYAYTVGLLLQLDWLDYTAAKQATFAFGLENTFIDIFLTQYTKAGGDTDPDMQTDLNWGAGLRMEF